MQDDFKASADFQRDNCLMFRIENIIEPSRLRLIWQSGSEADRTKYHVADLVRAGFSYALYYRTMSPDFVDALRAGFRGHPAFDVRTAVHHHNVLEIFMKRLPPRNRSDFWLFLEKNGLTGNAAISDFSLLGYSGARLPGDGFCLEIDFALERPPFQYFCEISGFRYYQGMQMDMEGLRAQSVFLLPEPSNPKDPNAIQIFVEGVKIGYIPRSQAPLFNTWLKNASVHAWVSRIEGAPAKPLVFLFVRIASTQMHFPALTS